MTHSLFAALFADRPEAYPRALEDRFERILIRIAELWGSPALEAYFEDLMIDKRGGRQGFPQDVAHDIFCLYSTYEALRARGEIHSPWDNENASERLEQGHTLQDFNKAVETNDVRRMAAIIDGGMPVDLRLSNGWTPLMVATFNSCEEAALLLIERGASATVTDSEDYTPLHWAALNGFTRAVPLLIGHGARVNADNRYGFTPLLQAASRGHVGVARHLIDSGAWVNHQDREGWTPLHKAVSNGHLELALLLLSSGANPGLAHRSGLTAADIARESKFASMRRLFTTAH